jgi:hypothetical protein
MSTHLARGTCTVSCSTYEWVQIGMMQTFLFGARTHGHMGQAPLTDES